MLKSKLQIGSVEFHIADLLNYHSLDLVAVLLILFRTLFDGLICAGQSLLHHALWLNGLLLALVTYLPGLLLAVLRVAILLGLLGTSLHLKLADFLWLEMAVLLFHREGKDVRELLAIPMNVSLANFHLDLSGNVVAILLWFPSADNFLLSISIRLGGLLAPTVELHRVSTGDIIDNLLLHVAVRRLNIAALVIVLCGGINLVGCVTDAIFAREASLYLVRFFESFVVNGFHEITNQFINIEANTLDVSFNYASAILEELGLANFLVLGPASLLFVWLALVLKHHLFNFMTVRILVHSIASNISLPDIRIVFLNGRWRRIFLRNFWRSTKDSKHNTAKQDDTLHETHNS